MSIANEFTNRELETRDPRKLIIVTAEKIKRFPETSEERATLIKYHDLRADAPLDEGVLSSVKQLGAVHTPVFITNVEGFGEIVIAGRQRVRAAIAANLPEVPVIVHSNEDKVNILLELTENLSRRGNTVRESAYAYQKALDSGLTQSEIASMVGVTEATISYALTIGEMPKIVHDYIAAGKLSPTAALSVSKATGKKAPKGSTRRKTYDEKEVKTFLESLDEQASQEGGSNVKGSKIKVKQANNSKAAFAEGLTSKEWNALYEAEDVPDDYKALIGVFINKLSMAQAKAASPENLDWLRKIAPQPKPKKVKEPKVKESKKEAKAVEPSADPNFDPASLFGG